MKMKTRLGAYVSTALIALTAANAGASLLFYDGFDYTAGALLAPTNDTIAIPNPGLHNVDYNVDWRYAGAGAAANKAPAIASSGLTYPAPSVPSSGNSVLFDATQIGIARIQINPTAINSGTVYWSGLLQVGTVANLNAVNGMLLGGFNNTPGPGTSASSVGACLRIRQASGDTTKYNIGTAMNSGTGSGAGGANIQWGTGSYAAGQTVFVVGSYEFVTGTVNDVARMWINPSLSDFGTTLAPGGNITSAPGFNIADSFASLSTFNLRNVNSVGTPTGVLFDELRVGESWADVTPIPEPPATGLLGLGMLVVAGWYRSRRH